MQIRDFLSGVIGSLIPGYYTAKCFEFTRNIWDDLFTITVMILSGVIAALALEIFRRKFPRKNKRRYY